MFDVGEFSIPPKSHRDPTVIAPAGADIGWGPKPRSPPALLQALCPSMENRMGAKRRETGSPKCFPRYDEN